MITRGQALRIVAVMAGLLTGLPAWAQAAGPETSAGPGRITCKSAASCELGLGTPAKLTYHIDASALPDADKARLAKQCTAKAKTPCVATVAGTEMQDPMKIKATKITWHN